jgi:hypothetical protein
MNKYDKAIKQYIIRIRQGIIRERRMNITRSECSMCEARVGRVHKVTCVLYQCDDDLRAARAELQGFRAGWRREIAVFKALFGG